MLHVKTKFRWWFWPYVFLTRMGAIIGLPINEAVVTEDLKKGIYFEFWNEA